jgi:hypothetical protein
MRRGARKQLQLPQARQRAEDGNALSPYLTS